MLSTGCYFASSSTTETKQVMLSTFGKEILFKRITYAELTVRSDYNDFLEVAALRNQGCVT